MSIEDFFYGGYRHFSVEKGGIPLNLLPLDQRYSAIDRQILSLARSSLTIRTLIEKIENKL